MISNSLRLALLLTVVVATPLTAQADILTPDGGLMFWTLVVFIIVLAVLAKFAFPHILKSVEEREEHIRQLLAEAEAERAESTALLEKQRAELEAIRARTQDILADSREAAETARTEMLAEARKEQEEIIRRTERELAVRVERAMEQVRRDAVVLAIAAAEKLLEAKLDDEANRQLVESYLASLDRASRPAVAAGV